MIILQHRADFFQDQLLSFLGTSAQTRLNELQILEDQIGPALPRHQERIRLQRTLLVHDIYLGVSLLARLDQLVGLIEPGIFEIVFARFYSGDAGQS